MTKPKPPSHFLSHTALHLLGVFVVLLLATIVGIFFPKDQLAQMGLAQTISTTKEGDSSGVTDSTNVVTAKEGESLTSALPEVMFFATVSTKVECEKTGAPQTSVFLLVSHAGGGGFILTSDTGMNGAQMEWGEYPLQNGSYYWRAFVKPGYVGVGNLSGKFIVNSSCAKVEAADSVVAPTSVATSTDSPPPSDTVTLKEEIFLEPMSPPLLKLFLDNKPADLSRAITSDEVELRVTTIAAKEVRLYRLMNGEEVEFGRAVRDDLLSISGSDVWSFMWNLDKEKGERTKIYARVAHRDGRVTESERLAIVATHEEEIVSLSAPAIFSKEVISNISNEAVVQELRVDTMSDDPGSCGGREECAAYCGKGVEGESECRAFAREEVAIPSVSRSLAEEIPKERLEAVLAAREKRPKELPEFVQTTKEFTAYCGDLARAEVCTKVLVRNDLASTEELSTKKEVLAMLREGEKKIFTERVGVRVFQDSDGDGVTDYDEINLYRTDPNKADTDGDGSPDGIELFARTNPRGGAPEVVAVGTSSETRIEESDESVVVENPLFSGVTEPDVLAVTDVKGVATEGVTGTSTKVALSGKALPNSFVTLFIFSDPIVVVVRADENGNWAYTLDKELPDGTHQVYSAITDSGGRILAKSEPLSFVKTAAAVSLGSLASPAPTPSAPGFFSGASLYALIAIVVGVIGIAFSVVGFMARRFPESGSGLS